MAIEIGKGIPIILDPAFFKVRWFKLFVAHIFDNILINENNCWVWQGYVYWNNTTCFVLKGFKFSARRASYMTFKGQIPEGYTVKAYCRNCRCVSPDHLFLDKTGKHYAKHEIHKVEDRG